MSRISSLSRVGIVLVSLQLIIIYLLSRNGPDESIHFPPPARRLNNHNKDLLLPNDGTLNGIPLYFRDEPLEYSTISCVGDNFQIDAHFYRSCLFQNMCFDMELQDFVIVPSPHEQEWLESIHNDSSSSLFTSAVDTNVSVLLGGVNIKWGESPADKLEWFPQVLTQGRISRFYQLPNDHVWIPYHSYAAFNPGHLVLDDFLPIYTLLTMFGLESYKPLLMRFILKDGPLWATCDWKEEFRKRCDTMIPKFLPLLGKSATFMTNQNVTFQSNTPKSKYICARHGVAGMGSLTDHGTQKTHGWQQRDYAITHNVARGGAFYQFRKFMMNNVHVSTTMTTPTRPYNIVFSVNSSSSWKRSLDFQPQIQALQQTFNNNDSEIQVQAHVLQNMTLVNQVQLASTASIFISSAGGGAVTAMFVPRGSSLILYYQHDESRSSMTKTFGPARLDWDFFQHLSHVKVHWLPVKNMNTKQGLKVFTKLVQNEISSIQQSG